MTRRRARPRCSPACADGSPVRVSGAKAAAARGERTDRERAERGGGVSDPRGPVRVRMVRQECRVGSWIRQARSVAFSASFCRWAPSGRALGGLRQHSHGSTSWHIRSDGRAGHGAASAVSTTRSPRFNWFAAATVAARSSLTAFARPAGTTGASRSWSVRPTDLRATGGARRGVTPSAGSSSSDSGRPFGFGPAAEVAYSPADRRRSRTAPAVQPEARALTRPTPASVSLATIEIER